MPKLKMASDAAKALTVPEDCCCYAWRAGSISSMRRIAERAATEVVVKGLIERDAAGHLALTDRGRAMLLAMLPDL